MMYGDINSRLEIVMDINLSTQSVSVTVPAIVDTGFSDFLTLPQSLIDELALPSIGTVFARMADTRLVSVVT